MFIYDHAGHPFQIQLSRALVGRGYEVIHAYCARLTTPRGNFTQALERLVVLPIDIGSEFERHGLWMRWRQEGRLGRAIAKEICRYSPDIVMVANTPLRTQAVLQKQARDQGSAYILWLQDLLSVGIDGAMRQRLGPLGGLIGRYFASYEAKLIRNASKTIAISEDFLDFLPTEVLRKGQVQVIKNWAPFDEVPEMDRDNVWAREQGVADRLHFLYAGTLGLKHNPEALLALAQNVKDCGAVVTVISEGDVADWVKREAVRRSLANLKVLPFQPFERIPEILGSADVLLALLERDAGMFAVPSKVLTYLCAGRPVLAAIPVQNLAARTIREAGAGVCVEPDDPLSFAAAGRRLAGDEAGRYGMGKSARAYARRMFNIDQIAERFDLVFYEAVARNCITGNDTTNKSSRGQST